MQLTLRNPQQKTIIKYKSQPILFNCRGRVYYPFIPIMFDVSWGEIGVLTGLGLVLIGRRDLPLASHALGKQLGRIVGLLQGARLRADRFATDHQLKALQNEFRSGLRELDAVKAELAGAMMSNSRGIGATVPGVDRRKTSAAMAMGAGAASSAGVAAGMASSLQTSGQQVALAGMPLSPPPTEGINNNMGAEYLAAAQEAEAASQNNPPISTLDETISHNLAPRSQSIAAVAEEEWEKQGIGFQSIAERGKFGDISLDRTANSDVRGGATILSNFIRQSLIYDQYERTVREQDDALRSRVEKVRKERSNVDNSSSKT